MTIIDILNAHPVVALIAAVIAIGVISRVIRYIIKLSIRYATLIATGLVVSGGGISEYSGLTNITGLFH